jgi:branched-chain amino acid transport system substrate-binding protein
MEAAMARSMLRSVLILLLLLTAGLDPSSSQTTAQKIEIDTILPLTGFFSFIGKQEQSALQIGEQVVNKTGGIRGRPISFSFSDDQSNPQFSVQLTRQIVAKKPAILLGTSVTASCNAMLPLLRTGPVTYCFSPGVYPQSGSYMLSASVSTRDSQSALVRYFRMRGWTRIALITSTDATGQDGEAGLDEALKNPDNKDISLVERTRFNLTDVSVSAQIERLKASQPQAIIVWTVGTSFATVLKGLIQGGVDLPIGTTHGNMTYAQMRQYADFLPKELYKPSSQWPLETAPGVTLNPDVMAAKKVFFDALAAGGVEADLAPTLVWDPLMILVGALRTIGPDANAEQILGHIQRLKNFSGINGPYDFEKFPQRGLGEEASLVTRWRPDLKTWQIVSQPTGIPVQ